MTSHEADRLSSLDRAFLTTFGRFWEGKEANAVMEPADWTEALAGAEAASLEAPARSLLANECPTSLLRAQLHAGFARERRHPLQIALEGVKVDDQGRRIDFVQGHADRCRRLDGHTGSPPAGGGAIAHSGDLYSPAAPYPRGRAAPATVPSRFPAAGATRRNPRAHGRPPPALRRACLLRRPPEPVAVQCVLAPCADDIGRGVQRHTRLLINVSISGAHQTPFQAAQATSREPSNVMSSATYRITSSPIHAIQG